MRMRLKELSQVINQTLRNRIGLTICWGKCFEICKMLVIVQIRLIMLKNNRRYQSSHICTHAWRLLGSHSRSNVTTWKFCHDSYFKHLRITKCFASTVSCNLRHVGGEGGGGRGGKVSCPSRGLAFAQAREPSLSFFRVTPLRELSSPPHLFHCKSHRPSLDERCVGSQAWRKGPQQSQKQITPALCDGDKLCHKCFSPVFPRTVTVASLEGESSLTKCQSVDLRNRCWVDALCWWNVTTSCSTVLLPHRKCQRVKSHPTSSMKKKKAQVCFCQKHREICTRSMLPRLSFEAKFLNTFLAKHHELSLSLFFIMDKAERSETMSCSAKHRLVDDSGTSVSKRLLLPSKLCLVFRHTKVVCFSNHLNFLSLLKTEWSLRTSSGVERATSGTVQPQLNISLDHFGPWARFARTSKCMLGFLSSSSVSVSVSFSVSLVHRQPGGMKEEKKKEIIHQHMSRERSEQRPGRYRQKIRARIG